jgi:hypothetical protein
MASTGKKYSVADLMKIRTIARRKPKANTLFHTLNRFSKAQNGDPPFLCHIMKGRTALYFCEDQARLEAYVQGRTRLSWLPRAYKGMTVGSLPTPPVSVSTSLPITRIIHREVAYFRLTKNEFNAVKKRYKATARKGSTPVYKLRENFFRMVVYEPNGDVAFYSEGPTDAWKPEIEVLFGAELANDLENAYTERLGAIRRPIRLERGQAIDQSQFPCKVSGKLYINHATGRRTLVRNGDSQMKDEVDFHGPAGAEEIADTEKVAQMLAGNWAVVAYNEMIGFKTELAGMRGDISAMRVEFREMKEKLPDLIGTAVAKAIRKEMFPEPEQGYKSEKPKKSDFWYG